MIQLDERLFSSLGQSEGSILCALHGYRIMLLQGRSQSGGSITSTGVTMLIFVFETDLSDVLSVSVSRQVSHPELTLSERGLDPLCSSWQLDYSL